MVYVVSLRMDFRMCFVNPLFFHSLLAQVRALTSIQHAFQQRWPNHLILN